jgi:hypothetical protein
VSPSPVGRAASGSNATATGGLQAQQTSKTGGNSNSSSNSRPKVIEWAANQVLLTPLSEIPGARCGDSIRFDCCCCCCCSSSSSSSSLNHIGSRILTFPFLCSARRA